MSAVKLQTGDRVSFLDEVGGGVVVRPGRLGHVLVRTHDGLELERSIKSLVRAMDKESGMRLKVSDHQAGMIAANDALEERKRARAGVRPGKTPKRPEDNSVAEVDLHLHELVEDETKLSHDEKLRYQLAYFERALESAIRDGKRKLIVIHGVGEGVLREEVRKALQYYEG
ncbi:MAG TPA: hypothetical protein PK760_14440, partial [Flavobacteriales bacterium]|nr:hypothetical protein [Flavobacteriales bacterium]